MTYQEFKNKYLGGRVDYDRVYGYQCVDLIKAYLNQCYGLKPLAWGNAIDYWYSTNATVLTKFDRLSTSSARRGDIVIMKGVNGNPYGHIGIADGNAGITSIPLLEQNGATGNGSGVGGDSIRVRSIPRWRVVGVLRQKVSVPPTNMMPAPGSKIQLRRGTTRTTFKAGTTKVAGKLVVRDDSYIYTVRAYDPVYKNRILINSASAGGNGVALALYYTNGAVIDVWKKI